MKYKNRKYFSKGFKKLLKHYKRTVAKDSFQNELRSLRNKFKIPEDGLDKPKSYEDHPFTIWEPPRNWEYISDKTKRNELADELKKLAMKFDLESVESKGVSFYQLFFYDILTLKNTQGYCRIEKAENIGIKNDRNRSEYGSLEDSDYAVALLISPDASQRDINDHIRKNWDLIEKIQISQKKTGEKQISRERTKEERDEFIYKNKHLHHKKIVSMVADKFGEILEYPRISQIISKIEKRKE